METPSAPAHRGSMAWHLSLLTASLLTFWNPSTTAQQLNVVMVPSKAVKGKEVLLFARNMPEQFLHTTWYKGTNLNNSKIITRNSEDVIIGPKIKSRKSIYENGSLLIQNLILEDTGNYRIKVLTKENNTISGEGYLHVYEEEGTIGMPVWTFLSILIGVLFGVKLTALVGYFLFLRFRRNSGQHDSRQLQPTSGSLGPGAPSSSSSQST